jgi:hypothetical protein
VKEFIGLLILPILVIIFLQFGNIALVGFGLWGLGLYINDRISKRSDESERQITSFIRVNEEYALEKKCLYYFLPSLSPHFDSYILDRLNIDKNSLYLVPKNPQFIGTNAKPYIKILSLDSKWDLKDGLRKFEYRSAKVDNIILKINAYEARRSSSQAFKTKKEMNLHPFKSGFGHIQQSSHRSLENQKLKNQSSLSHKVIYFLLAFFILSSISSLIFYFESKMGKY